jgi:ribosome-associated protein
MKFKEDIMENNDNNVVKVKVSPLELAEFCKACAEEKMAEDVVIIHVGNVSSIADYYMVATANSEPQLRAVNNFIERQVRDKYAIRALNQPSDSASGWLLLDFNTVLIHLMTPETRSRYNLEALWGDNPTSDDVAALNEKFPRQ